MDQELTRLFNARLEQAQALLQIPAEEAARLLRLIFERSTSPELLAIMYREYALLLQIQAPPVIDNAPSEQAAPQTRASEPEQASPQVELKVEAQVESEVESIQTEPAPACAPAPLRAEPESAASAADNWLDEPDTEPAVAETATITEPAATLEPPQESIAEEAESVSSSHQQAAEPSIPESPYPESPESPAQAELAAEETPWQTHNLIRQIELIQNSQDLEQLLENYASARDIIIKEIILSRLSHLIQAQIVEAGSARELEVLGGEILPQIEMPLQGELMSLLAEYWQIIIQARIERAETIEDLSALKMRLSLFWIVCENLNASKQVLELTYLELLKKWLNLALEEEDLQDIELPPQFIDTGEQMHPPLQAADLRQQANQLWDDFLEAKVEAADSLRALKHLYQSQDWEELYRPAKRLLLNLWNQRTSEALDQALSFAEIGQIVRHGGSQQAINRWIEQASNWHEVSEICSVLDLNAHKGRAYSQLVEKIFAFADTEDRIREAQGLLRSHTLSWMMGNK